MPPAPPTAQAQGSGAAASVTAEAESIYNLLPKSYSALSAKPPLYISPRLRQAARQPPVASTIGAFGTAHLLGQARLERRAWANWGPAGSQAPDPKRFLRRGEGRKAQQAQGATTTITTTTTITPQSLHHPDMEARKPPVPSHVCPPSGGTERVVYDHIYANAMDAITATPPPPPEPSIDPLRKPDYGQVPAYLAAVKEEIRREDAILQRFLKRQQKQQQHQQQSRRSGSAQEDEEGKLTGVVAPLAEAERRILVDALKAKWDTVNAAYQKTAHHGGRHRLSGGARQRKEAQERALQQLEADIEMLERGGTMGGIYVRYDNTGGAKPSGPAAEAREGGTGTAAA